MSSKQVRFFGITFVGLTSANAKKLLLTVVLVIAVFAARRILEFLLVRLASVRSNQRFYFWTDQALRILSASVVIIGIVSIWSSSPEHLVTVGGLIGAGVAFALQKVITAIAAYFVLLRGKTFNVGDRITMGGVRGDVVALGFIQTTIMEMGQPPPEQADAPAMWVRARQYTGRIVTVTNDKIFDQPVYNYSRDFPFLWEELQIPVSYKDKREAAEKILLDVAGKHALRTEQISAPALHHLEQKYQIRPSDLHPRVFIRLTDNWIEMSLRFITPISGIREIKDRMSREIIDRFDQEGIGIASGTYEIVGMPPLKVDRAVVDELLHR